MSGKRSYTSVEGGYVEFPLRFLVSADQATVFRTAELSSSGEVIEALSEYIDYDTDKCVLDLTQEIAKNPTVYLEEVRSERLERAMDEMRLELEELNKAKSLRLKAMTETEEGKERTEEDEAEEDEPGAEPGEAELGGETDLGGATDDSSTKTSRRRRRRKSPK